MFTVLKASSAGNPQELLHAAIEYARRGWSIIPTIGKRSAGTWKAFQDRAADEQTLRCLFKRKGIDGIAVILGRVSGGLACRDFDDAEAYLRWAADHQDLAALLPTVKTARGYHVYFVGPERFENLGDGEYRGDSRHYCLLPPSRHPSGSSYSWLVPLPSSGSMPSIDPVNSGLLTRSSLQAKKQPHILHSPHPHSHPHSHSHPPHILHMSDERVSAAIVATQPTAPGQRNNRLWQLARRLKGINPDAKIGELEIVVRAWHARALPNIATKDWLETWIDFRTSWTKVKTPFGATLDEIVNTAVSATKNEDADPIERLVALCRSFQQHWGPGIAWPLSCRVAANAIGVGHDTAARLLRMLVMEGTLEQVRPAGPKVSKRAAMYRLAYGE